MDCLRAEVLGQDPALQAVEDMLKVVRADIADPRRPLFSALLSRKASPRRQRPGYRKT